MGCIVASMASSVACCFCSSAAGLCCSCLPGCKSSSASRVMFGFVLLLGTTLSAICLAPGLRTTLAKVPALCGSVKVSVVDTGFSSGFNCDLVVGYSAVYRICFAMACFFFLFAVVMLRVQSSHDPRSKVQNGFWFFKFLLLAALVVAAFFIPMQGFTTSWMVIGMIGGFLYIVIQLILIVDFAHAWNQAWLEGYEREDDGSKAYCCGLVFFTLAFYALALAGVVCLFIFYAGDASCGLNKFFISFNLVLCVVVSVVSVLPRVQERLPYSGLLQSSLMSLYMVYLTWSAMTNEPYPKCNPTLVMKNVTLAGVTTLAPFVGTTAQPATRETAELLFNWHSVVGLFVFFLTVCYSSIRSSAHTSVGKLTMAGAESTQLMENSGGDGDDVETRGQRVWDNEAEAVAYNYSMFHAMLFLASLYIMMTLTSWYAPEGSDLTTLYANMAGTWVKMSSAWLCQALYLWTLVAPLLFPDREFS